MVKPFRIVTVCTGNVCRSPAAELLLRRGLGPDVVVESAGVQALVDHPIDPGMAEALIPLGLGGQQVTARALEPGMVERADLVLCMAREHRAAVAEIVPAAVRRLYTLTEFAALLAGWEEDGRLRPFYTRRVADRLGEFLAVAPRLRGTVGLSPADHDIPDPYRQSAEDYRDAAERIARAAAVIVGCLDGTASGRPAVTPDPVRAGEGDPGAGPASDGWLRGLLARLLS